MSRIVQAEPLNWKLALPILGLVACAAFYAYAEPARAADQPAASHHRWHSSDDGYALVRDGDHGTSLNGDSAHWDEINAIKSQVKGEFLWFRDGGKSYIVQDPDILTRAHAAWAPVDKMGQQMDVYGGQMSEHGAQMEKLSGQMMAQVGKQVAAAFDQEKNRDFERKMNELGRQMGVLGDRMGEAGSEAERDRFQRQMNALSQQMSQLGAKYGREQAAAGRELGQAKAEEVGKRMKSLSAPMDELGRKMGALGKDMERASLAADKTTRELIREAQAKGVARPAPAGSGHST